MSARVSVVVPISGGKDSQATLKLALMNFPRDQVRGLFCDTRFEHPDTYAHVESLRTMYGPLRIDTVNAGSVEEQCLKHERFPGSGSRFCTEELKIWPTKRYLHALAVEQGSRRSLKKRKITGSNAGGFEVWYGMRSDESTERKERYAGKVGQDIYPPHEVLKKYPKYLHKLGVLFRLPVLEWSKADILGFLDGQEHPHYAHGFDRVGCFPCQAAGDAHKEKAYAFDEFGAEQKRKVIAISQVIKKPIFNSIGGQARFEAENGPGCAMCSY